MKTSAFQSSATAALQPGVSVIVVNHNRAQLLRDCLRSLLEQVEPPDEILVVDNASTDNSVAVCHELNDGRVRVLSQQQNLGFAAANNIGIRQAQFEFTALLNNDAEAMPHWLANLSAALRSHPDVGMTACKILLSGTEVIDKAGHLIFPDGQNRGRGTGERDEGQFDHLEETIFPDGCAAMYRTRLLWEVGGFDESFFAYAEDADLGLRIRLRGWGCLYVPTSIVHHHHSSTMGAYSLRKVYWVERNRLWLAAKTFPWPLLVLNPFFVLYRWLWNGLAALLGRGPGGQAAAQSSAVDVMVAIVRATWDGLIGLPDCLAKRKSARAAKRLSDWELLRLLWRFRIKARNLAFDDSSRLKP